MKLDKKFLKNNWKLIAAIAYVLSPIDFIPDVLPFLGVGDDALVLGATLAHKFLQYRKENKKINSDPKTKIVEGEIIE